MVPRSVVPTSLPSRVRVPNAQPHSSACLSVIAVGISQALGGNAITAASHPAVVHTVPLRQAVLLYLRGEHRT